MDRAERLVNWELEHGFPGLYASGGRSIYRKCECGRRTDRLADAQCTVCKGLIRVNQRFQCRKEGCSGQARKGWGMLCRACWVAEDPERAARVLREWEEERGFAGMFYGSYIVRKCACGRPTKTLNQVTCGGLCTKLGNKIASAASKVRHVCVIDGCARVANYQGKTLCEPCYVQADPDARGCSRCKAYRRIQSREDRLCTHCVRRDVKAAIREIAGHSLRHNERRSTCEVPRAALADWIRFDEADTEDLEDALGAHLGECVAVD